MSNMNFCIVQKPELYGGLWETYGTDHQLFNLISRTSSAMFLYESKKVNTSAGARLRNDHLLIKSLDEVVGGVLLRTILDTHDPFEMLKVFLVARPTHLAICGLYHGGFESLLSVMVLRTLQWRHLKGYRKSQGKVTKLRFGSDLNQVEKDTLEKGVSILNSY